MSCFPVQRNVTVNINCWQTVAILTKENQSGLPIGKMLSEKAVFFKRQQKDKFRRDWELPSLTSYFMQKYLFKHIWQATRGCLNTFNYGKFITQYVATLLFLFKWFWYYKVSKCWDKIIFLQLSPLACFPGLLSGITFFLHSGITVHSLEHNSLLWTKYPQFCWLFSPVTPLESSLFRWSSLDIF